MLGFPCRGIDMDYLVGPSLRPTGSAGPISHMDLPARLEDPAATKALVTWNNNIAASSPQQRRIRHALRREDLFHVALDLFPTDTTDFADILLPASSFLEFNDLVLSYFNYSVSAQVKAVDPIGKSFPNQEIFRRLSRAMGLSDPDCSRPTPTYSINCCSRPESVKLFRRSRSKGPSRTATSRSCLSRPQISHPKRKNRDRVGAVSQARLAICADTICG